MFLWVLVEAFQMDAMGTEYLSDSGVQITDLYWSEVFLGSVVTSYPSALKSCLRPRFTIAANPLTVDLTHLSSRFLHICKALVPYVHLTFTRLLKLCGKEVKPFNSSAPERLMTQLHLSTEVYLCVSSHTSSEKTNMLPLSFEVCHLPAEHFLFTSHLLFISSPFWALMSFLGPAKWSALQQKPVEDVPLQYDAVFHIFILPDVCKFNTVSEKSDFWLQIRLIVLCVWALNKNVTLSCPWMQ